MTIYPTTQRMIDPIAALVAHAREDAGARPATLVAMHIDVTLTGGLAITETTRTFRNDEAEPIEALLSLPVPVHAAFFGLTAKIDDRLLIGIAQARHEARHTYEDAITEGKTAVLHEELLRGVHSLSVGNLAAGGAIEVTTRWADTLRSAGASRGRLRIPMTVGDVYGLAPLPETDQLTHGEGLKRVSLRIRHDAADLRLATGALQASEDGALVGEAPANAPVDIEVEGWKPAVLKGKAWDGRDISLRVEAAASEEETVRAAVLVDHSGSMQSRCEGDAGQGVSKHEAVRNGLRALAGDLREADRLSLWEFDHTCNPAGGRFATSPGAFAKAVDTLAPPAGGTEIGGALGYVFEKTDPCDVLLITDGKSYALDVHDLAQAGRRVFVVLVGEDSLEANVGHLAALTGGDIYFSFGADVGSALHAALQGLRTKRTIREQGPPAETQFPESVCATRGNMRIRAAWSGEPAEMAVERDALSEGVAAYAANLALASLPESAAGELAVGEGLTTHLTSLVLVDEAGPVQEGLPVTRKVNLPTPRTDAQVAYSLAAPQVVCESRSKYSYDALTLPLPMPIPEIPDLGPPSPDMSEAEQELQRERQPEYLRLVVSGIDWQKQGRALGECDLSGVHPEIADAIRALADRKDVQERAAEWGIEPIRLALALVAAWAAMGYYGGQNRNARRVKRRLLKGVANSDIFIIHFSWFCQGHLIIDYAPPASLQRELARRDQTP